MLTSDCLAGLTAEDLYHPDPPPVPLAGHLHPRQLGPGEHLRELGVLGAQVLTGENIWSCVIKIFDAALQKYLY